MNYIGGKFSVKYFLCWQLIDQENERYQKMHEFNIFRAKWIYFIKMGICKSAPVYEPYIYVPLYFAYDDDEELPLKETPETL